MDDGLDMEMDEEDRYSSVLRPAPGRGAPAPAPRGRGRPSDAPDWRKKTIASTSPRPAPEANIGTTQAKKEQPSAAVDTSAVVKQEEEKSVDVEAIAVEVKETTVVVEESIIVAAPVQV